VPKVPGVNSKYQAPNFKQIPILKIKNPKTTSFIQTLNFQTLNSEQPSGPPAGRAGKSKINNQKFAIINQSARGALKFGVPGVQSGLVPTFLSSSLFRHHSRHSDDEGGGLPCRQAGIPCFERQNYLLFAKAG